MLRIVLLLSFFAILAVPAHADDFTADSKLRTVTVYTGRAMLTRRATVDIPAGAHTIVFEGLQADLLPDSLRAEGSAAASVTFGALASKIVADAELVSPREKELTDRLLELTDRRDAMEAEKQALGAKLSFLDMLGKQGGLRQQEEIAKIELKPDQWAGAAQAIYAGVSETLKAQLAQGVAIRELDKEIGKLRTEIAQLRTGRRTTYRVALPVEADKAARLTIDLSYQIPGATWTPVYDARLDTKTGALELTQFGAVTQNSGEDWTDVALTLSTAQPQRGTGLPDLDPLWVSLDMQQETRRLNKTAFAVEGMATMAARAPMAMEADMAGGVAEIAEQKAEFITAEIETGGFVSEYKIPGPSSVPADGTQTKLMIGAFETANEMQIQVKPQVSADAYLVAHTTLKGEAPVLPGTVNLFRDGAFVGQAYLPLLRPGEENDLAFGIDDQVAVKRRVMKDERGQSGVIAKDNVLERHFLTELQNLHAQPVKVMVLEAIPVARDERINVSLVDDKTTSGYKKDMNNVKGLLQWDVSMKEKQKTEIGLGWKVNWPKDQNLNGL